MKTTRANCLPNFDQAKKLLEQFREDDEVVTSCQAAYDRLGHDVSVKILVQFEILGEIREWLMPLNLIECCGDNVIGGSIDHINRVCLGYEVPANYPCLVEK